MVGNALHATAWNCLGLADIDDSIQIGMRLGNYA